MNCIIDLLRDKGNPVTEFWWDAYWNDPVSTVSKERLEPTWADFATWIWNNV